MPEPPLYMWVAGPLPPGVEDVLDRLQRTEGVAHIAIMPDVHLASEFCVGTVVASDRHFFLNAVGGDIGCGMLAMQFDADASVLADPQMAARILGGLYQVCPARRHHRRRAHAIPPEIHDATLSDTHLESQKNSEDLRTQLGTLGAGNHFLELQRDAYSGALWLMLHTGSRHLGQIIFHHHLARARKLDTQLMAMPADSPEGRAYANDMHVARMWARHNRRLLALRAAGVIGEILHTAPLPETLLDCDHNHVQLETHASTPLWIHRKGATAAHADQPGLIPGTMGTRSFHTRGRGLTESLASSSHGAGRALSRTQARQKVTRSVLRRQLRDVFYDARIEPLLLEEAPAAYKDIHAVMAAQQDLTRITRTLHPVLIYKGT